MVWLSLWSFIVLKVGGRLYMAGILFKVPCLSGAFLICRHLGSMPLYLALVVVFRLVVLCFAFSGVIGWAFVLPSCFKAVILLFIGWVIGPPCYKKLLRFTL